MSENSSFPLSLGVVGSADCDLIGVLESAGVRCHVFDSVQAAVDSAAATGAIAVLASAYPQQHTRLEAADYAKIRQKQLRVYIEFPESLPQLGAGQLRAASRLERGIVMGEAFAPELAAGSLLLVSARTLSCFKVEEPLLAIGKVAGFDTLAYPLAETAVDALLFHLPESDVLVATTRLSQMRQGRFMPHRSWEVIWAYILRWLLPQLEENPSWQPLVRASFSEQENLPQAAVQQALQRGVDWFANSCQFVPASAQAEAFYQEQVADSHRIVSQWQGADGSAGVLEGFVSQIDADGLQPVRWWRRADCNGEVAGACALVGAVLKNPAVQQTGENLANWLYFKSNMLQGERADATNPAYGLVGWNDRPRYGQFAEEDGWGVYYGDDNARVFLGTLAVAGALGSSDWDRLLVRGILANLRTTGRHGLRRNSIFHTQLVQNGWRYYFNETQAISRQFSPHYQCYLWACYLWLYEHTKDPMLLEYALSGIRALMDSYPQGWHWTNGIQQERARMLLVLAWLVRVQDTPEHRGWLEKMTAEVLKFQVGCGAISEQIGETEGKYGPPASHADYGKQEASLLQQNGDPVADQLYTTNFAFLGLHEAAAATGSPYYKEAADKLAEFFIRSQARSEQSELDGAWFRAFDFKRWENWGSDSDGGWAAWCVETGWTQAWILAVLSMRELGTSLWQLHSGEGIAALYAEEKAVLLANASE